MWARANMAKKWCGVSLKLYREAPLSTSLLPSRSVHSFHSCEGNMVPWVHLQLQKTIREGGAENHLIYIYINK